MLLRKSIFELLDQDEISRLIRQGVPMSKVYEDNITKIGEEIRPSYFAFCKFINKKGYKEQKPIKKIRKKPIKKIRKKPNGEATSSPTKKLKVTEIKKSCKQNCTNNAVLPLKSAMEPVASKRILPSPTQRKDNMSKRFYPYMTREDFEFLPHCAAEIDVLCKKLNAKIKRSSFCFKGNVASFSRLKHATQIVVFSRCFHGNYYALRSKKDISPRLVEQLKLSELNPNEIICYVAKYLQDDLRGTAHAPEQDILADSDESFVATIELESALRKLTQEQQRILEMHYYEGLTFTEIAQIHDKSRIWAFRECQKALEALRGEMV